MDAGLPTCSLLKAVLEKSFSSGSHVRVELNQMPHIFKQSCLWTVQTVAEKLIF